eukprot:TCONS_00035368-protein
MDTDKFFISLPSDSSMSVYPDNKISKYTTYFPDEIKVSPTQWKVALKEIIFPHSWYTIKDGSNTIIKFYYNITEDETLNLTKSTTPYTFLKDKSGKDTLAKLITVKPGIYQNILDIIKALNKQDEGDIRPMDFSLDITSKTSVTIFRDCTIKWNNSDIAKCFGFDPSGDISSISALDEKITIISNSIGTTQPLEIIYVYSDIVENQHVGDFKVPLLRIIPIRSKFGEINWVRFDKPQFLKLSRENINNIEINIRDNLGQLVSFESGRAIITLVFERISTRFYQ